MNPVFRFTILFSLFIHLTVYVALMVNFEEPLQQSASLPAEQTMEFVLAPPATPTVEPTAEQDEPPPPKHMEDDINKANTSDGLVESGGKQTPKPKGQKTEVLNETDAAAPSESPELLSSSLSDLLQQAIKNVEVEKANDSEEKEQMGEQLNKDDDSGEDQNLVKSPFEKAKEEKARWRNLVLKRITEQIKFAWVKPAHSNRANFGVIGLNIDPKGYLKGSWVKISSGDPRLDDSILRAIHSVWRLQIPESDRLSHFYRNLEFSYSGRDH